MINEIKDKELVPLKMAMDDDFDSDKYKSARKPTDPKSKTPVMQTPQT